MEFSKSSNVNEQLFQKVGIKLAHDSVEVGKTYPIYGTITRLINDEPGNVIAEINHSIRAKMNILDQDKVDLLKQRAFESGIFISKVTSKEPNVEVDCQTVIFGRPQGFSA